MLAEAYVLHPGDVEVKDGVIYLPLYMAGLLQNEIFDVIYIIVPIHPKGKRPLGFLGTII